MDKREKFSKLIMRNVHYKKVCEKLCISKSTYYLWKEKLFIIKERHNKKSVTYEMYRRLLEQYEHLNFMLEILYSCDILPSIKERELIIDKYSDRYKVADLCRALHVSKGTYYNHKRSKTNYTYHETRNELLKDEIAKAFDDTGGRLGIGKIVSLLKKRGIYTSERKVSEIMKIIGLETIQMKKKSQVRNRNKYGVEPNMNYLNRQFDQAEPNIYWASDVTDLKIKTGRYHLIIIMDLFSRKVIGWNISLHNDTALVVDTFKDTFIKRGKPKLYGFHSDQGSNYISLEFKALLAKNNILQSFSNKGNPYDNAVIESFNSRLKAEEFNCRAYKKYEELYQSISDYIEFYNNVRPHESLGMLTPNEMEEKFYNGDLY